jgi:amino acid transporter
MADTRTNDKNKSGTLGTFAGVFTPSILTILGIILFLRTGYVVGSAGLARALIIIGIANLISVLTSVSLSAIATNLKVKGGGDYYLISRTLGLEFGGAIGIVLFLAQAVSIAFYCIGFGEALVASPLLTAHVVSPRLIAAAAVAFLFVFAWLGADWATRFQYVVMALLAAALASFFVGGFSRWDAALLTANWAAPTGGPPFWALFALFFPAVTGFTQGVSMSGDLKDPGKSLPLGTFMAVGVSIMVYFGAALMFSGTLSNPKLAADYAAMNRVAAYSGLIDAGVIAATLSSAMASFLGAPRILQSLAADRIFPGLHFFARGAGPAANPRRAVVLAAGIAFVTIALGNLNLIAPVVSMFFLISYGLLNYATYYEAHAASPSFRPTFKWFDQRLSLLGFLACLGVMLAIDPKTALVAAGLLAAIYQYLRRTAGPARWADGQRAHHLQQARAHLLAAAADPGHPRDWRPQILAFSNDAERRARLLTVAGWLEGGSGLTTLVQLVDDTGGHVGPRRVDLAKRLDIDIARAGSTAFALPVVVPDGALSLPTVIQTAGSGPLRANTVLVNWLDPAAAPVDSIKRYVLGRSLRTVFDLGCSIAVLATDEARWQATLASPEARRVIDVYWRDDATGRLVLLLAYLMTRAAFWAEAVLRVRPVTDAEWTPDQRSRLDQVLDEARIAAVPLAAGAVPDEQIPPAAMALVPFELTGERITLFQGRDVADALAHLPTALLVLSAADIDLAAAPEEGEAARIAAAADALHEAERHLHRAEQEVRDARGDLDGIHARLTALEQAPDTAARKEVLTELREAADDHARRVRLAGRRAERAALRVHTATRQAEALGIVAAPEDDEAS